MIAAAIMHRRLTLGGAQLPLPIGLEWSQVDDTYSRLTMPTAPAAIGLAWDKTTDVYTILSR